MRDRQDQPRARALKGKPGGLRSTAAPVILVSFVHYAGLLLLTLLVFLASHVPPKAVNLESVVLALFRGETILTGPRKIMLWLWPGENTPGLLSFLATVLNSLLWGCVLAGLRYLWKKVR